MTWKKEKPCLKPVIGCLKCGGGEMKKEGDVILADMNTRIYGGFGGWCITCDNKCVYDPPYEGEWESFPLLREFEEKARLNPDHDWRACLMTPLRDAEYQRQGKDKWVLVKSGMGFA